MKITKLIIPLLGISSINNANKKELLQMEKIPEISYEVSVKDNWDNYCYSSDTNISKSRSEVKQLNSQKNEIRKPIQAFTPEECIEKYQQALALCALLGPICPTLYCGCFGGFGCLFIRSNLVHV